MQQRTLALFFFEYTPQFNVSQSGFRRPKRFKTQHGPDAPFYKAAILFYDVIQILTLLDFNPFVFISIILVDSGCIRATFVDTDKTLLAVRYDRLLEKT